MNVKKRRLQVLTVVVILLSFSIFYHSPSRSDTTFPWPMFVPAITGGVCKIGPFWSAYTAVCCLSSSLTFSVTVSGETKNSTAPSCSEAPTWEGWSETSAGPKSVVWQIVSPTCGTYNGTFPSLVMDKGGYYGYQLELGTDGLVLWLYSWKACTAPTKSTSAMKYVKEISLDIPLDVFGKNCMPLNSF